MIDESSFFGGSAPVGSIIQAPYNLTDPAWLPCNGAKLVRSAYPSLSACLPSVGTFTLTARTKLTPGYGGGAITNDGTNWIMGNNQPSGIMTTPNGITYTNRNAGVSPNALGFDGVNVVAIANTGVGAYSSNGGVGWAYSGGVNPAAAAQHSLAWAPSLGTVGRFCTMAGIASCWTSDDRGVTWVARTLAVSGGVTCAWTGAKFIANSSSAGLLQTSSDGITWTSLPIAGAQLTPTSIVSDGAGKVLAWDSTAGVAMTSSDHGATWAFRSFGNPFASTNIGGRLSGPAILSYSNARFFLQTTSGLFVSSDLIAWAQILDWPLTTVGSFVFNYKAGVYFAALDSAALTTAFTLVEDVTKMYLPIGAQGAVGSAGGAATSPTSGNNFQPFIKVK